MKKMYKSKKNFERKPKMLVAKVVTVLNILNTGFIEATKELAAKQVK